MSSPPTQLNANDILVVIILCGLLGLVGQGIRAAVGLKNSASPQSGQQSVFDAAYLTVSLMIGFIAGVLAGFGLGFDSFAHLSSDNLKILLGVVAAGYAGTDFIENTFARLIPAARATAPDGRSVVAPVPEDNAALAASRIAPARNAAAAGMAGAVTYGSLVPGGFFSSDPFDLHVHRSIRTNNPGALNITSWQKLRKGYAGVTQPDNSPDRNKTTIYRTPEHGVAAWFYLLNSLYRVGHSFSLGDLALHYAGGNASQSAIDAYVQGWARWSGGSLDAQSRMDADSTGDMLKLGKAMFSHEAAMITPLHDDQIIYGIEHERDGTLPA